MKAQRLRLRCSLLASRIADVLSHKHTHDARFAKLHELAPLLGNRLIRPSLTLGIGPYFHPLRVEPSKPRPELGNILINAPTRRGKGLLAVSQILTWQGPLVVNDIKGELYDQTAGYRKLYGPVYRFGDVPLFVELHRASVAGMEVTRPWNSPQPGFPG